MPHNWLHSLALGQNGDGRGALEGDGGGRGVDVHVLRLGFGHRVEEPAPTTAQKVSRRGQSRRRRRERAHALCCPPSRPRRRNHGSELFIYSNHSIRPFNLLRLDWCHLLTCQALNAVDVDGLLLPPPPPAAALLDRAERPKLLVRGVAEPDAVHGLRLRLCGLPRISRASIYSQSR